MNFPGFAIPLNLPDLWQQEAVRNVRAGKDVIVDAPTGAGKTRIFEILVEGGHLKGGQAVYTVPTRALANDKRLEWQRKGWNVGIVTGEIVENRDAPVVVATLETQRERLLRGEGPKLLVIDEYQMLADPVRGAAYETVIALAPPSTRLLLLSGSVANPEDVAAWLRRLGRDAEVVSTKVRPVPLEEMPVEQLERRAPKKITGFWPRLAAEVLLSGLGPLLIFAPHRAMAEKIARQIAGGVPTPDPLPLTREQEHILGRDLAPLLQARVACHHSGLSWQQRAGVIEPLAKAGQLRVVCATMGLAAGINFSMRSVIVADTRYFDGRVDRELEPDELLQMFGRAGRRGLDETGYVILSNRSPRLSDATPRRLKRVNQIDWPPILRVMHRAARTGRPPFEAAARFCESLFSRQKIVLGFEGETPAPVAGKGREGPAERSGKNGKSPGAGEEALFGLEPARRQIRNSRGEWEDHRRDRARQAPLREARIWKDGKLLPALHVQEFAASAFPANAGRVCRLRNGGGVFGREWAVAIEKAPGVFALTRPVRALAGREAAPEYSLAELNEKLPRWLEPQLRGGRPAALVQRRDTLTLQADYSDVFWTVYEDQAGVPLVAPEERMYSERRPADFTTAGGVARTAASHTAVYAWRKLGLIAPDGTPTRRGVLFSCFQGGEGLAIAAALEDESYPLDDLASHLANLRGGYRFSEAQRGGDSERLAAVCLQTYGAANYEGYLDAGLPHGYGEGTAERLAAAARAGRRAVAGDMPSASPLGDGDLERAFSEWLSLLRQVAHAPEIEDWPRWNEFKAVCRAEWERRLPALPSRDLPAIPASQLAHQPAHHLVAV